MSQTEMDFGVFGTSACDHVRRRNGPPTPDADGLFDVDGVTNICGRRQCEPEFKSDLFATVRRFQGTTRRVYDKEIVSLTATAPGPGIPWRCWRHARAHGNRVYEIDYDKVTPASDAGLDDLRIAMSSAPAASGHISRRIASGVLT